ncbi:MAG TPA: hypothetical protein VNX21_05325 [Candidatus Thermoplasmatota archaeon]|nr:hypothetical protein [Candidatus Thermoplasmatota archaeon]
MEWALVLVVALLGGALVALLVARGSLKRLRALGPRIFERRSAAQEQAPRYRDVRFERDIFDEGEDEETRERNAWR